uniref:Uncharacterized protein n=1 Tax=Arundo donax TaxID=35708 RepID=A0A0A9ELB3_ARUDO
MLDYIAYTKTNKMFEHGCLYLQYYTNIIVNIEHVQ